MKIVVHAEKDITLYEKEPLTVSELLRREGTGISVAMPCGGNHTCGKCRVRVRGEVSPCSEREAALLGEAGSETRLACMTQITGDCEIFAPKKENANIVSDGITPHFRFSPDGRSYGFAADIGTTTVALYLYNLKTGEKLAETAFPNPQQSFGADVITRVGASVSGKRQELQRLIGEALSAALNKLCRESSVKKNKVDSAVITGNTAMLYMLTAKDVACLAAAPFEINDYLGRSFWAAECGIDGFYETKVYLPHIISPFVGSDITCSLLAASELMKTKTTSLLIDIGTNGEMALRTGALTLCCSTAAGPAFEGAGITMGTMSVPGAVNTVQVKNGEITYSTIGEKTAVGICGSGLVDAASAFRQLGLVDESGRIDTESKYSQYICEYDGQPSLKIGDSAVVLTQKDIRALQLAKSAIRAGIEALLNAADITANETESLILAGGFGSFIRPESAAKIGLVPPLLAEKAVAAGNAAGAGAAAILLSETAKKESAALVKTARTVDLTTSPFFMNSYIENMLFPE